MVVETRAKKYPPRLKANPGFKKDPIYRRRSNGAVVAFRVRSRRQDDRLPDSGGEGTEIVKEVLACPACVASR